MPWWLTIISPLLVTDFVQSQIAKPEIVQTLDVPTLPDLEDGNIEETYHSRANVTWPDGSGYSVISPLSFDRTNHNLLIKCKM